MSIKDYSLQLPESTELYTELRLQENTRQVIQLLNGDVTSNSRETVSGCSVRVCKQGQWGFASAPEINEPAIAGILREAVQNAEFLASRQGNPEHQLPSGYFSSERDLSSDLPAPTLTQQMEFMQAADQYIQTNCPNLQSRILRLHLEDIEKRLLTSGGSKGYSLIPRSVLYVTLSILNNKDEPVELTHVFSHRGQYQDNFSDPSLLFAAIDSLYQHLLNKREAVPAEAGLKEVILGSELTGILAHEAVGHPTEADLVLSGAVTGKLLNQKVASPLVNMVDLAHTLDGETLPVPVFIDDEGTEAKDAVLIENGVLKGYMTNRHTAAELNMPVSGNARAFKFYDEPLIRMRNTAILPGNDKLEDMIASIDDGYYLIKTNNGEADTTSEFMFGVTLGYEIKNGKPGRAITDTTISGIAFDTLKTVSMVSDEIHWECSGYCGKKQIIPVGCGGPAIKCKVHIGGE